MRAVYKAQENLPSFEHCVLMTRCDPSGKVNSGSMFKRPMAFPFPITEVLQSEQIALHVSRVFPRTIASILDRNNLPVMLRTMLFSRTSAPRSASIGLTRPRPFASRADRMVDYSPKPLLASKDTSLLIVSIDVVDSVRLRSDNPSRSHRIFGLEVLLVFFELFI